MTAIDLATVRFSIFDDMEMRIHGTRHDGTEVLVGTVDTDFPLLGHQIADALGAHGVAVDRSQLADAETQLIRACIEYVTMRVSTGPDGSPWTDLETRSSIGKYAAAGLREEFDPVTEAVAALHPPPAGH